MPISVVIADDQEVVRMGFRMVLESQHDIQVLADVTDGEAALAAVERLRPDVLLLDIRMPRTDGLEVTRRLTERAAARPGHRPTPGIVIVTTFDLDEYVHTALRGGASGFLLKDASPALLVEAVRAAAAGEALLSPAITARLLRDMVPAATGDGPPAPPPSRSPTANGTSSARWPGAGPTPRSCGALYLSLSTVKSHLANVQIKLDARNRVEVAFWAWQSGLSSGSP